MADSRPYEIQLVETLRSIAQALKYGSGGGSSSSQISTSSASSISTRIENLVAALNTTNEHLKKICSALIYKETIGGVVIERSLGELIASIKTSSEDIKKALDGTTANGVSKKVEEVGNKIQTGDANIVAALGTTNTTLQSVATSASNIDNNTDTVESKLASVDSTLSTISSGVTSIDGKIESNGT